MKPEIHSLLPSHPTAPEKIPSLDSVWQRRGGDPIEHEFLILMLSFSSLSTSNMLLHSLVYLSNFANARCQSQRACSQKVLQKARSKDQIRLPKLQRLDPIYPKHWSSTNPSIRFSHSPPLHHAHQATKSPPPSITMLYSPFSDVDNDM